MVLYINQIPILLPAETPHLKGYAFEIPSALVVDFLLDYYSVLPNKPHEWLKMIEMIKGKENVRLLPF